MRILEASEVAWEGSGSLFFAGVASGFGRATKEFVFAQEREDVEGLSAKVNLSIALQWKGFRVFKGCQAYGSDDTWPRRLAVNLKVLLEYHGLMKPTD